MRYFVNLSTASLVVSLLAVSTACMSDKKIIEQLPDRWEKVSSVIALDRVTAMTAASGGRAVYVGSERGQVRLIYQYGTAATSLNITQQNYNGSNAPYTATVTSINVNGAGTVFAGTDGPGIYVRHDPIWSDTPYGASIPSNVRALISTPQTMLAAAESGIYRLTGHWQLVYETSPDRRPTCFAHDPADGPTGALYAGTRLGLLKSKDDGRTWERVDPSNALLKSPVDIGVFTWLSKSVVYVLTRQTLAKSSDSGKSWEEVTWVETFPPNRQFTSLAIRPAAGTPDIYIGSTNTGITFRPWNATSQQWITDANDRGLKTNNVPWCDVYENGRVFVGGDGVYMDKPH